MSVVKNQNKLSFLGGGGEVGRGEDYRVHQKEVYSWKVFAKPGRSTKRKI